MSEEEFEEMVDSFLNRVDGIECTIEEYRANLRSIISAANMRLAASVAMQKNGER